MAFQPTETCPEPGIYRNPVSGELSPLPGYGCMQEETRPLLDSEIDWTAPIYEQIFNTDGSFKSPAENQQSVAA